MFHRKLPEVPQADLIDLLLDSDEPTRKVLVFQALQTGTIGKSEAEAVMAQVMRLERAAAPSQLEVEGETEVPAAGRLACNASTSARQAARTG